MFDYAQFVLVVLLSFPWVKKFSWAWYNASQYHLSGLGESCNSLEKWAGCNNLNPDGAGHLGFDSFLGGNGFLGFFEIGALSILSRNPVKWTRSVLHIFPTETGAPNAYRSSPSSEWGKIKSMLPESFLTRKKTAQLRFSKRQLCLVNLRYIVPFPSIFKKHQPFKSHLKG